MNSRSFLTVLAFFSGLWCSCSEDHGGADGGDPDSDGRADGDGGGDGPGEPFRLIFEPGAQACAQFSEYRNAAQELALRGRMAFVVGTLELPRDAGSFAADIVAELEVTGPEPVRAQPQGAGEMVHRLETALWGYCHRYTFTQAYRAGARPVAIRAEFSFCKKNNVSDPATLRFDQDNPGEEPRGYVEDSQVKILGLLDGGEDYLTQKQFYRSCTYATLPRFRVTAVLEGGDTVVLSKRYLKPLMASGPAAITRAEIALDGEHGVVEDYFKLAYAADLHNFNQSYLAVLDPPLGEIHGIYLAETDQHTPPEFVDLLGAGLDPSRPQERRRVVDYQQVEDP